MLDLYLSSIIVWFIILISSAIVCRKMIVEKGWIKINKKPARFKSLMFTLVIAAIPVFRLLVCGIMFFMATVSKEEYYKMKNMRIEFYNPKLSTGSIK